MNDDVAGLVERLEKLVVMDEVRSDNPLGQEAASTIRTLVEENGRLRQYGMDTDADAEAQFKRAEALSAKLRVSDALLREAVEVIRRWHMADLTGHDGSLSRARQVSEAFLATMEKPRD